MIKKITAILIVLSLAVFAVSCGEDSDETKSEKTSSEKSSETVTEAETKSEPASFTFDESKLKEDENGFLTYSDDSGSSEIGVDVSSYSGSVDWNSLKDKGVLFAIIRAGGRGYGDEGAMYSDESLEYNLSGADAAGIETGVYFFSQAVSTAEAEAEADYVIEHINGRNVKYVAYDFERIEDDDARTDAVKDSEIPAFAKAFCSKVSSAGYEPLIYLDSEETDIYSSVKDIPFWIACYEGTPEITEQVKIWQYKKSVGIKDAEGSIDLNIMF